MAPSYVPLSSSPWLPAPASGLPTRPAGDGAWLAPATAQAALLPRVGPQRAGRVAKPTSTQWGHLSVWSNVKPASKAFMHWARMGAAVCCSAHTTGSCQVAVSQLPCLLAVHLGPSRDLELWGPSWRFICSVSGTEGLCGGTEGLHGGSCVLSLAQRASVPRTHLPPCTQG